MTATDRIPGDGGCLYLVPTPIGNLQDISPRARDTLATCDLVACENSARAARLFRHLDMRPPTIVYHEGNEQKQAIHLADTIAGGGSVALITEAGTPGISDPGFRVVRECRRRGLSIVPLPGPVAATTALSASGLPTDGFLFLGFLPPKKSARRTTFHRYADFPHTLVFYESTHRIGKFLDDLVDTLGPDRAISVSRELTKLHETIHSGPAGAVRDAVTAASLKGEFVVCVAKSDYAI